MENTISLENCWDTIIQAIPEIKTLEHITFHKVPANVLDTLTQMMPQLVNISTWAIIGDQEILPVAKSLDNWSEAVRKVNCGQLTLACAASLYNISEKDLSQLIEPKFSYHLTADDTNHILLTCMRLSKMGFNVQLSTLVLKGLELLSNKYIKDGLYALLLKHCSDLYARNLPLLESDNTQSTDIKCQLEGYYSSLGRLQQICQKRIKKFPSSRVLVLDSKVFSVSIKGVSVNITGLSLMSACPETGVYPLMLISPAMIGLNHPYIIMAQGKEGVANSQLVFTYLSRMIKKEFNRPKIIVCNSSPDLFSEKLISCCLSGSVYLQCVPKDLAKYVFPGCLGGPLFRIKTYVDNTSSLSVEKFFEFIINHFQSKSEIIKDIIQAFTASGLYPLNPKAPFEYNKDLSASVEKTHSVETVSSLKQPPNQKAKKARKMETALSLISPIGKVSDSIIEIDLTEDESTNLAEGSSSGLLKTTEKNNLKQGKTFTLVLQSSEGPVSKKLKSHNTAALKVSEKSDKISVLGITGNAISDHVAIEDGSGDRSTKSKSKQSSTVRSESVNNCASATEQIKSDKIISSGKTENISVKSQVGNVLNDKRVSGYIGKCAINVTKGSSKKLFKHKYLPNVRLKKKMNKAKKLVKLACIKLIQKTHLSTLTDTDTNNISYVPFKKEESLFGAHKKETKSNQNDKMVVNSGIAESRAGDESHIHAPSLGEVSHLTLQTHKSKNDVNLSSRIPEKCFDKVLKASDGRVAVEDSRKEKAPREESNSSTKGLRKSKSSVKKRPHRRKDSDNDIPDKSFDMLIKKHILNDGAKVVTEVIKNDFSELTGSDYVQQVTLTDHDYFRKSFDNELKGEQASPDTSSAPKPVTRGAAGKLPTLTPIKSKEDMTGKESSPSSSQSSSCSDDVDSSDETSADSDWSQSKPEGIQRNKRRQKKKTKTESSDLSDTSSAESKSEEASDEEESSEEDKTESKCQICFKSNPPNYKGEVIDWVECDGNCHRWFHVVCITRTQGTADIENYICTYCTNSS